MITPFYIEYSERIKGQALFAKHAYKKGDVLYTLIGKISTVPTKYTIEIGTDLHILDKFGYYMNHSSTPSIYIHNRQIIALKHIDIDDEITFDYNKNETKCVSPFYDLDNNILVTGSKNIGQKY